MYAGLFLWKSLMCYQCSRYNCHWLLTAVILQQPFITSLSTNKSGFTRQFNVISKRDVSCNITQSLYMLQTLQYTVSSPDPKGHVRQCHHLASINFYILIFFFEIDWNQTWKKYSLDGPLQSLWFLFVDQKYTTTKNAFLFRILIYFEKGTKFRNFTYLKGIKNFYFSSNFDVFFVVEWIVSRVFGCILVDFLYLLLFLR